MKTMSVNCKNAFMTRMARVASREESMKHVFTTLCNEFKGDQENKWDVEHMEFVRAIGSANSDERAKLWQAYQRKFNYVVYNANDFPTVVDIHEVTELSDYKEKEEFFKEYHLAGAKAVKCAQPQRRIIVEEDAPIMVTFTLDYGTGYKDKIERPKKDKDGNVMTEKRNVCYAVTPKSRFGYTKDVFAHFIEALEECAE